MQKYIEKGYAEEVDEEDDAQGQVWYLPHHGVRRPTKKKLRVVFDAAAKFG